MRENVVFVFLSLAYLLNILRCLHKLYLVAMLKSPTNDLYADHQGLGSNQAIGHRLLKRDSPIFIHASGTLWWEQH